MSVYKQSASLSIPRDHQTIESSDKKSYLHSLRIFLQDFQLSEKETDNHRTSDLTQIKYAAISVSMIVSQ